VTFNHGVEGSSPSALTKSYLSGPWNSTEHRYGLRCPRHRQQQHTTELARVALDLNNHIVARIDQLVAWSVQ
jgi:hypothetical protein